MMVILRVINTAAVTRGSGEEVLCLIENVAASLSYRYQRAHTQYVDLPILHRDNNTILYSHSQVYSSLLSTAIKC